MGKNNGNSKAKKLNESDRIFKETIKKWDDLAQEVLCDLFDTVGALDLTEDFYGSSSAKEKDERLIDQIKVVNRALRRTKEQAQALAESLSGASIIKPIDEIEATIIGAVRELDRVDKVGSVGCYRSGKTYKALAPLFQLAKERANFSLPVWLTEYLRLENLRAVQGD